MSFKVGDYILTKHNNLFRIMNIYTDDTGTYVDIKNYVVGQFYKSDNNYLHLRAVPGDQLAKIGKIVPEEKASKMLKILYG